MEAGSTPGAAAPGREIALLTNPTAGKGRGRRAGEVALRRLRDAGFAVRWDPLESTCRHASLSIL